MATNAQDEELHNEGTVKREKLQPLTATPTRQQMDAVLVQPPIAGLEADIGGI